jgi:P4 family phage/plasmid primase-like protien
VTGDPIDARASRPYVHDKLATICRRRGLDFDAAHYRLSDILRTFDGAPGVSDYDAWIDQIVRELEKNVPAPERSAPQDSNAIVFPPDLFIDNPKTGKPDPAFAAFLRWFRSADRFVVPIERGTFSNPSAFELLRYDGGYYNGMARAYLRGRIEDAFRLNGSAGRDSFREEVVKGIGATSEFHRKRETFNPPDELCLANGVLNTTTGVIGPHSPETVFTWKMPVAHDPTATCPTFEAFLEKVQPDPKRRELIVDLMGYCLWRKNPFQTFFVNVGDGANGKTTWMRVLGDLLGPDAVAAESLQNLSTHRFAAAELEGRLANLCDDLPYDRPLAATGVLKILAGEGEFTGERKFLPKFKFRFEGKLIANANRTPEVKDDSYAFWRRLVAIPWEITIPEAERDPALPDKLRAELSGILNLALTGLARCRARTRFDPEGVFENSREEWRSRADIVRAELLEEYEAVPDAGAFMPNSDLYSWHVNRSQGEGREPLTERAFGVRVARAFPASRVERRKVAGRYLWGRPGMRRKGPTPVFFDSEADDIQKRLDGALGSPESPERPASGISHQEVTIPTPVFPVDPIPDNVRETGGTRAGTDPTGKTGVGAVREGPADGAKVAYPESCSPPSDGMTKTRHGNCPNCLAIGSHVCYACPACRWFEAHGSEGGP